MPFQNGITSEGLPIENLKLHRLDTTNLIFSHVHRFIWILWGINPKMSQLENIIEECDQKSLKKNDTK